MSEEIIEYLEDVPLIKIYKKSPLVLSGIVLEILRGFFKQDNLYTFNNNPVESKLDIDASYRWNPDRTQDRPGIYVKRGQISYSKTGTDNLYKIGSIRIPSREEPNISLSNLKGSVRTYSTFGTCNIIVECISKEPGEAEELANRAHNVLLGYEALIRRDFYFHHFYTEQIGEISTLEEHKEHFLVPIIIFCRWGETWEIRQESLTLNKICLDNKPKA